MTKFEKVCRGRFRVDVSADGVTFTLTAYVTVPRGYPDKPCTFELSLVPVRSNR